jgi:hypothetical protein
MVARGNRYGRAEIISPAFLPVRDQVLDGPGWSLRRNNVASLCVNDFPKPRALPS